MQAVREHIATIVAGVAVAAILAVVVVLFGPWHTTNGSNLAAVVHDSDGNERRLRLDQDATLEVTTSLGRNVIVVQSGEVRVAEADCPQGSCMQQQPISRPGQQLICLPHKLWVEVLSGEDASSELDPNAVAYSDPNNVDLVAR